MDSENKKRQRGGARLQKTERAEQRKSSAKKFFRPKPRRTRKQKILFVLYIIITVIAALIVAGFIAWNLFSAPPDTGSLATRPPQTTTVIGENGEEVEVEVPGISSDRKDQFYTVLLVGQDTLGGGNTDTMMLGAYDVLNQKLSVLSLPRDTYVKWNGSTVLLNSIYNRGGGGDKGMEALKEKIGELTGVVPDYHVIVQWEAVGELVDAIGGVWFEVPQRMYYNDLSQGFKIDLQKGYQLLDGDKAMQLIRYRLDSDDSGHYFGGYAMGDLGRIQTQQAFMTAIIAKCLQPDVLLPKLTEYIRIFQENVVTDLSVSNMAYFAKSAVGGLDMDNVEFVTLPYKAAGQHLLPDASAIVEVINESFNPYKDDIQLSELNVVTSAPASSSSGSKTTTTVETTDEPADDAGDSETEDGSETGGEPAGPDESGTTDTPDDSGGTGTSGSGSGGTGTSGNSGGSSTPGSSGATEQPGSSEETTPPDHPETTAPENPSPAQDPEETPIPPPPPEAAA